MRSYSKNTLEFTNEGKYEVAKSLCKKEMRRLKLQYIKNIEKGVKDDIGIFLDIVFMLFILAEVWGLQSNHDDKCKKLIHDIEKMLTKKLFPQQWLTSDDMGHNGKA